jgi:endonuclease YncB( thermonuclease family)
VRELSFNSRTILGSALMVLTFVVSIPGSGSAQEPLTGTASVIDADTIEIHGVRIRLHGIDAPEGRQQCHREDGTPWRCGQEAALVLADHIGHAVVRCEPSDRDRYGRVVAICYKGSEDINRWLVANGWAAAYREYSVDYVADENSARNEKRGVWPGNFEMPWEWRRGGRH